MRDKRLGRFTVRNTAARTFGGTPESAIAFIAAQRWTEADRHKSAIGSMTESDPSIWREIATDLMPLIVPQSVIDRLPGVRRVPIGVRAITQTTRASAGFVAPGAPIPVSRAAFSATTLLAKKIAGIVPCTEELLRVGGDAEITLSDDLAAAIGYAGDVALLDSGAVSDARPASIVNGAHTITSTGASVAQIDADIGNAIDSLIALGANLATAAWIMSATSASFLSRVRGSGGALAYPGITARGGSLGGIEVLTTAAIAHVGSPVSAKLVLCDGSGLRLADPGAIEIDTSREGALELQDNPSNDAATGFATTMVSLMQTDAVAIKCVRRLNWERSRPCVVVIAGVPF